MEFRVKRDNCRKRAREDGCVPVHPIYKEELSDIYAKGYDVVNEISKHDNDETRLCKERWNILGTEQNPEKSPKLYFRRKFYVGQITPDFFESITLMTHQKEFLSSVGKNVNVYLEAGLLFFRRHI
jgi:hypothetical protein